LLLLAILAAGSFYLLTNWLPSNRSPVIPALAGLCTIIGSTLFGFITQPEIAMASIFDIGIMVLLGALLAWRPGKWSAIVLIAFMVLEVAGSGYVVFIAGGDGFLKFQIIIGSVIEIIIIGLLIRYLVNGTEMLPDDLGDVFE
jgi:hypothetical protein